MDAQKYNRVLSKQMEKDVQNDLLLHGHAIVKQYGETVYEQYIGENCLDGK